MEVCFILYLSKMDIKLNVNQRNGVKSPHKPLLVLLALGAFQRGETLRWTEVRKILGAKLKERGLTAHPEYPFLRLQNDEIWHVQGFEDIRRKVSIRELNDMDPVGRFAEEIQRELRESPGAFERACESICKTTFFRQKERICSFGVASPRRENGQPAFTHRAQTTMRP